MRRLVAGGALLAAACGGTPEGTDANVQQHPPVDPRMLLEVPAGGFQMGHPGGMQAPYGSEWYVNETPRHEVTLRAFAIDRSEVPVRRYAWFLGLEGGGWHWSPLQPIDPDPTGGYTYVPHAGQADQPIRQVTWYDARAFCLWSGGRLPTEAEWERVARGAGDLRRYPWGDDGPTCLQAVFFNGSVPCAGGPVTVGTHLAGDTPEGVHDLAGNVAEWVADWWGDYSSDPQADPPGPATGTQKVVRGGGYRDLPQSLRTTARWGADPAARSEGVGFRCVYPR